MEDKRIAIFDKVTKEWFFVSEALSDFIRDNIDTLLKGEVLKDLCFAGEMKQLELNANMQFILSPVEELDTTVSPNKRMTEDEYNNLQSEYEIINKEYEGIRNKRAKIKQKLYWYNYRHKHKNNYKQSRAYEMFGKRYKDLNPEELREYNRVCAINTRKRR